jgi:glycosyltransferase involved in cell wall biosynthesis
MKKVLMIAPYFVPRRRVGSLRPFRFAIHLKKLGWNPVVLTLSSKGQQLTDKEKHLLNGIEIIEIDSPFDRTPGMNSREEVKPETSRSFVDVASDWIDKHTPADSWIFLFWLSYLKIYSKVKEIDPDLIWATGDPWSGLWLGEKLSSDFSKPFIADFRDPWTLADLNLRKRSSFSENQDREIEKKIIERADKLIFTAAQTRKSYEEFYDLPTEKSEVIYNSFDRGLINDENRTEWGVKLEKGKLQLIFFGAFRWLSPAGPIIDSLEELMKFNPEAVSQISVHSFGPMLSEEVKRIDSIGLSEIFVQHKPVLPQQMLSVLNKADLLLVSTHKKRSRIIPAKLWDYLATDKPILSITSNPEINTILQETNSGIGFSPDDKTGVAEFLKESVDAKSTGRSIFSKSKGMRDDRIRFESSETARVLAEIFDEVISGY